MSMQLNDSLQISASRVLLLRLTQTQNTNDLYNIRSNTYGFSHIQYQRIIIDWLLREYVYVEVQYKTLDIQIGE